MRRIIPVVLFLLLAPFLAIAEDNVLKSEVNTRVSQLAATIGDQYSQEYAKARGVQILALNKRDTRDKLAVAVAVFTVESFGLGNNHTQYLAVFANLSEASEGHPLKLSLLDFMAIGGKGWRSIKFKEIKLQQSR